MTGRVRSAGPARRARVPRFLLVGVLLGAVLAAGTAACGGPSGDPAPAPGARMDRGVPAPVENLPLVDQQGRATSLGAFRGRVLVLAQFMTSCQEACPLTTGAFLGIQRAVDAAGVGRQVALAELTVDPGRDTPSRLAAYASMTGVRWELLTGSGADLATFWRYFGVYYAKTPEADPPGTDWQTGGPYTYDVEHSNGLIVFDQRGRERFLTLDMPDLHGRLPAGLKEMLDRQGLANLARPGQFSWTVPQALRVISGVLGRPIPEVG